MNSSANYVAKRGVGWRRRLVASLRASLVDEPASLPPLGQGRLAVPVVIAQAAGANGFLRGCGGLLTEEAAGIASVLLLDGPRAGLVWRFHRHELARA